MSMAATTHMTEEQFFALPESMRKTELLDGEVIVSPAPNITHQVLVGRLFGLLARWADANPPSFCGLSPMDVRIASNRIVQPDLLLLLRGLSGTAIVTQVPDLVIEVLSSNHRYDRVTKRAVYEEAGVGEHWMVDPIHHHVEVVIAGEMGVVTERLASVVAPGFVVDLPSLFRPVR